MIHVDGQTVVVMESVTDRMRLKDKIVANIAKAIKSVQELQATTGTSTVTLGNDDWQCHRLCEHLDHAFLHGLRHVTPGYWKIVSEFTHKDCVKEIKRMRHVTTDLGRGRAWLFMALNECLLESYIRCYQQNDRLVNKYYVSDALVRDHQRWNLILTLTSGLENAVFQLECDVPYLDLCVYPPDSRRHRAGTLEAAANFDRLSLCSMESVCAPSRPLAQAVVVRSPNVQSQKSDSDTNSTGSFDVNSSTHSNQRYSPSVDSGCHSDWNFRQRSITPIDQDKASSETGSIGRLDSSDRLDSIEESSGIHSEKGSIQRMESTGSYTEIVDTEAGELEIIRLQKHVKVHKRRKKKKKQSEENDKVPKFDKNRLSLEIPPIDEVKFEDAIMNCQNNNIESSSSGYSLSSDLRSPGDGHEGNENLTNGAINISATNSSVNSVGDISKSKSGMQDDKRNTPVKDYAVPDRAKSGQILATNGNSGGEFQEILKARASDIVDKDKNIDKINVEKGKTIDKSKTVEKKEIVQNCKDFDKSKIVDKSKTIDQSKSKAGDKSKTVDRDKVIDKKVCDIVDNVDSVQNVQYFSVQNVPEKSCMSDIGLDAIVDETRRVAPHLYSGSPIHDDEELKLESNSNRSINEKTGDFYGGPSIYSTEHDSELCSSENEENFDSHDFKRENYNTSAAKQLDKDSQTFSKGLDIYAVNSDSDSLGCTDTHEAKSTKPQSSNSSSPKPTTPTSHKLQNKQTSQSPSVSPCPKVTTIRQSPNQKEAYKASSNQKTETESQRSDDSKSVSSTLSSDVELQGSELELKGRVDDLINKPSADYQHLAFVEEADDDDADIHEVLEEERGRSRSLCDGEVYLDNNSMLFLMLDVLETNDSFVKMFSCRQGHTEGKTTTVFLLISTNSLYILSQLESGKFSREVTVPFLDIDFVSLGFHSQLIHLVCKNRRKKYWFTTGDERITIAIIDCLASSMEKSGSKPAKLEVDTGAMTQKISLRKYVRKECHCEDSEASILCYSLIHWEDPSAAVGSCQSDKEGNLLYKCNETANMLGYQTWKPAYAVLKDCMLCLYHDKNDPKPQHFLSMGGEQCVGCKRDFNSDRNHSIRVLLADGTYWSIALATEIDANDWIQALCQAVSEGLKMSPAKTSNIPCCMILTQQKLLMCHEDVETNFVRTLGSANLVEITAVLNDELCRTYIVLAFDSLEANVSSEKWVLYFNSQYECERFTKALSNCWATYFQVEVPVIPIDDFSLQKKCREMAEYLKKQLTLK